MAGTATLGPLYAWYVEPRWVELSRRSAVLPGLPAHLDGMRVIHLTDIHASVAVPLTFVRRMIERINRLEPDVVVVTGDLVTEDATWIDGVAAELGRLRSPHGTFAILGNHDYWTDGARISRALEREGIHHLRNESVRLGGANGLALLGIDDHWTGNDDLDRAMAGIGDDDGKLLLMHSPDLAYPASEANIDIALAGHTHGGQIRLPWYGSLVIPSTFGFEQGWYTVEGTRMYVNRGLGTLPLRARILCRPEVLELTLRTA